MGQQGIITLFFHHLENKGVPEQTGVVRVAKQEVQQALHHPGPVGLPGMYPGCHHHGFFGPLFFSPSTALRGRDGQHVHGIPAQTVAQHAELAVGGGSRVGGEAAQVALQAGVGVGVAVGQVAGVGVVGELAGPGERMQGGALTAGVFQACLTR